FLNQPDLRNDVGGGEGYLGLKIGLGKQGLDQVGEGSGAPGHNENLVLEILQLCKGKSPEVGNGDFRGTAEGGNCQHHFLPAKINTFQIVIVIAAAAGQINLSLYQPFPLLPEISIQGDQIYLGVLPVEVRVDGCQQPGTPVGRQTYPETLLRLA